MNFERMAVRFQQRIAEQALRYEGDLAVLTEENESLKEQVEALTQQLEDSKATNSPAAKTEPGK